MTISRQLRVSYIAVFEDRERMLTDLSYLKIVAGLDAATDVGEWARVWRLTGCSPFRTQACS